MIFIRAILIIFIITTYHVVIGQTIIPGGYVSGTWESSQSPYIVQDDILIHPDSTLAIHAGASVLFTGPFMLEVQGKLLVSGTPSAPVVFNRENDTITWRGIYFNTTDTSITDSSILEHGLVSHCHGAPCITISNSSQLRLSGFTIQYGESFRGAGINCMNSSPHLEGLLVQYNHSLDGAGISLENSSAVIKNCTITNNSADGAGGGIVIFDSGAPFFENCTISHNQSIGSHVNNCTFSDNESPQGSALATHNHTAVLRNSILWHSNPTNPGSLIHLDATLSWNVLNAGYSDIQNGQAGIELSDNAQFIWSQGNTDLDPGFLPESLELSWLSPCIEAGTPDTSGLMLPENDLAGDPRLVNERIDMGAFEYQYPVTIQNSKLKIKNSFRVYPNPAREWVYVEMNKNQSDGAIQLISPEGRILMNGVFPAGEKLIKIDVKPYPAGIYIISFQHDGFDYFNKLIIKD